MSETEIRNFHFYYSIIILFLNHRIVYIHYILCRTCSESDRHKSRLLEIVVYLFILFIERRLLYNNYVSINQCISAYDFFLNILVFH